MGFVDQLTESWKHWRRQRPKLSLVQTDYRSSGSGGCEYKVLLRIDGGSITREVDVALLLDGDLVDSELISVGSEGDQTVKLSVPTHLCSEAVPGAGYVADGDLHFEAWIDGKVAARIDGGPGESGLL